MIADFLGVILALAIVLVVAWFSLRLLARMQAAASGPGGGPATLRFLRALPVGARERLVVVAYHDEELLVGVTAGQITVIDRRPLTPPPPAAEAPAGPAPAWQGRLLQLLRRR